VLKRKMGTRTPLLEAQKEALKTERR